MIEYTAKLTDFVPKECMERLGVLPGGRVQECIDKAVIRHCEPYLPFRESILTESVYTASKIGSGEITYDTPYAHYLYEGEIWGPNFPIVENGVITGYYSPPEKKPTGRDLTYSTEVNPLAGSHWFDRAMADHVQDVLEEAQDAANRRGNP